MRRFCGLAILFCIAIIPAHAQTVNTITTVAGGGTNPTTATSAYLPGAFGAVWDKTTGNTYISVTSISVVYKVDSSGTITPYAGTGVIGFSGDGGPATSAQLDSPYGLAVDGSGNLFIADAFNNRIRKVSTNGTITTVAGSGIQYNGIGFFGGYSGDNGPATSAMMNFPEGVAVDANGNLFIADTVNNVIRKVDNSAQHIITTYAGGVVSPCAGATDNVGDGCPATQALLASPVGVAVDSTGNVYIGDPGYGLVRMVNTANPPVITAYAGSNATSCNGNLGDGSAATSASLCEPQGVFITSNDTLYIADVFDTRVRAVDNTAAHNISTIAGNGGVCETPSGCGDGGLPTAATLNQPSWVAVNGAGSVIIGDPGDNRFRIVTTGASPTISNFAGTGVGGDGSAATSAVIGQPYHVAVDNSKNLFVFDNGGGRLREVSAATNDISNIAGTGAFSIGGVPEGDGGSATAATFSSSVLQIWLDKPTGKIYIADNLNRVARVVVPGGDVNLVAGTAGSTCTGGSCGDGESATSAQFARVSGIATDSKGNVYVADGKLNRVRIVCGTGACPAPNIGTPTAGDIYNFAGTGTAGYSGDGGAAASANLNSPFGLAVDANDNLYIADAGNNRIRMVNTSGNISTVAFNGQPTFGGDGGSALSASMQFPQQVALDDLGNLFVGGGFDNVVRRIDASAATVITVAGDVHDLDGGFNGDGIASTQALISNYGLAIYTDPATKAHTLYIADPGNDRVRAVTLAPVAAITPSIPANFGPVLPAGMSTPGIVIITNNGLDDLNVTGAGVTGAGAADYAFTNSCFNAATQTPIPVAPGGTCILSVSLNPPGNAAAGLANATLSFNTNDPNNASASFALTGTVVTSPALTFQLTVTNPGTNGVITASPAGVVDGSLTPILCTMSAAANCIANYASGEQVILTALGQGGMTFTGWLINGSPSASCPNTSFSCTVTMNANTTVAATFGPATVTVGAMGNGSGTITINPGGTLCTVTNGAIVSPPCTATNFPAGTNTVTITATATGTSTFSGWLGLCSVNGISLAGTGPCNLPLTVAGITELNGSLVTAVFSVPVQKFGQGDVFVGTIDGMIFEYTNTGTLVQVLNSGSLGGLIAGMAFDVNGKLYAANPAASIEGNPANVTGTVETFDGTSATGTIFGTNQYNSSPIGVMIDMAGGVFVGQSAGQNSLLQFVVSAGMLPPMPTNTYFPAYEANSGASSFGGGIGYLDLLNDNTSVLYTTQTAGSNELGTVKDYDIVNLHQNPDFATGLTGGPAFAISEVSDGSVLVANTTQIVRLASNGTPMGAPSPYKPGGGGLFYALNLDPSGTSFWTGDALSGKVYQVQLSTGTVLTSIPTGLGFNSQALNFNTIFGIAVLGTPASGGTTASMTMTAPEDVVLGAPLTYTIQVTNPGGAALANVTVTDNPLPGGLSGISLSPQCTGTTSITCTINSLGAGQTVSLNFTIVPTALGELSNTAQLNGGNSVTVDTDVIAQTGTFPLTVEVDSANPVDFVASSPAAGTCTQAQLVCTSYFPSGTMVTLTANIFGDFIGWSVDGAPTAACPAGVNTCTVTMTAAHTVAAAYSSVAVASSQLNTGVVGVPYNSDLSRGIIGGVPPYTITLTGTLPGGLTYTAPTTTISGIPTTAGNTPLTVNITDSGENVGHTPVTLSIINAPTGQEALANGNYGVLIHMVNDSNASMTVAVGSLHFNGAGLVDSGTLDLISNPASPVSQTVSVTGKYTIGPDNRGLIELVSNGAPFATIAMSVGDVYQGVAHTAHIIKFDDNTGAGLRGAGIAKLQDPTAFNANTFAGPYVSGGTGQNSSLGRVVALSMFTVNPTATATGTFSGTADLNDNGTLSTPPLANGTYSATGLAVPIDPTTGISQWTANGGITSGVFVIIDADNALFAFSDTTPVYLLAGTMERQLVTSFDATFLSGPDVASRQGPLGATGNTNSRTHVGLATFTPAAGPAPTTGTVSATFDDNNGGSLSIETMENGTYTVASNGTAVFTFPTATVIVYLSRANHGYEMTSSIGGVATNPEFGEIDLQTGGPFSNALFATNFFWGEREPNAKGAIEGVTSVSNNSLNATLDQTHNDGRLDYDVQGSFGFVVAPNGRFLFTNNENTPQVAGDVVGLVITPSHVVFTELDPTQTHPSLLDALAVTMPAGVPVPTSETITFPNPVANPNNAQIVFNVTNNSDGLLSFVSAGSVLSTTDFNVTGPCITTFPTVLLPHSICPITVTFAPAAATPAGAVQEILTLATDAGNITITANGTVAASGGTTCPGTGATINWVGTAGDNQWTTVTNWDKGVLPATADIVCVGTNFASATITIGNLATAANQTIAGITSHATIAMNVGPLTVTGPANFTNALNINAGTLTLNGVATVATTLGLSGGILGGSGTVTVSGLVTWSGGTMSGTGTTNATVGVSFPTAANLTLNARTLITNGPATWSVGGGSFGTLTLAGSAVINNTANGTWNFQNDSVIRSADTTGIFNNGGLFEKSGGAAPGVGAGTTVGVTFNNTGTVTASAGTLSLNNGGNCGTTCAGTFNTTSPGMIQFGGGTFAASGNFTGTGTINVSAATLNVTGTFSVTGTTSTTGGTGNFLPGMKLASVGAIAITSGGTLNFSSGLPVTATTMNMNGIGFLTGSDTVTFSGLATWVGGTMSGTGVTTTNGGISFPSGSTQTLDTRTLNTNGTTTWSGGTGGALELMNGAVINNLVGATWNFQNDSKIALFPGTAGTPTFNNNGTFEKTGGTASPGTPVGVVFNNGGTVSANTGTLSFGGVFNQTGGSTILAGGILTFSPNPMNMTGGSLTGAGTVNGTVSNTGGTLAPGAAGVAGTISIAGATSNYTQTAGSFNVKIGGTAAGQFDTVSVANTVSLGGTLNVSLINAFTPASGQSFVILLATSIAGTFATTNLPALPAGLQWQVNISATTVTLAVVTSAGLPPSFTSTTLPNGAVTVPYGADIQVSGGTPPYTFALQSGSTLPTGFSLVPAATGGSAAAAGHVFNDSPAATGTFAFGITVTDSAEHSANATISLTIGTLPNTQPGLMNGQYGLLFRNTPDCGGGSCPSGETEGAATGSLKFDGIGGVTGVIDINSSGNGIVQDVAVSGTYSIGPDNRGFLTLTAPSISGNSLHVAFVAGDVYRGVARTARATDFHDDDGNRSIGSGFLVLQDPTAFSQTSFAGTYVAGLSGQDPSGGREAEGVLVAFDNALHVVSGTADVNDAGSLSSVTSITGTYTAPDTNGRIVLSLTTTPTGPGTAVVYIVSANQALVMTLDPRASNPVLIGTAMRQPNPGTFSASSLAGPDVFSLTGASSGGTFAGVGLLSVSGSTLSITLDKDDGGTVGVGQTASGSYTLAPSGRGIFSVTGTTGNGAGIFYLSQQDTGFILITDSSASLGPITPQVGAPFSANPFTGNFFFGIQEALVSDSSQFSGVAAAGSSGTFNLTDDESHTGGDLFLDRAPGVLTYSVDSTGHITAQTADGSNLAGYLTSPDEFLIFDTTGPTSDPTPSTHPKLVVFQTITAPKGTPSPASTSVTFTTPVAIGSSAQSSPILITNVGLGPLGISGIGVPPDFSFSSASTCLIGGTVILQPEGTCTFIITFAPSAGAKPGAQLSEQLLASTDGTSNITITATGTVAAASGPATHFLVAAPATATAGASFSFTVTAKDAANNTATGYTGTVNFSSTDAAAMLPASDVSLTQGVGTFSATLNTPGSQTITVTDTEFSSITGTSNTITVSTTAKPALSITKMHTGNFAIGQQGATYTVTVSNGTSAGPTNGAVTVTEIVPEGLVLSSVSGTGWSCGENTCTRSDALAGGASYPAITVTVNVTATSPTTVVNTVNVSGGGSATASASDTTNIVAVPFTLTIVPPAGGTPTTPIPVTPGGQVAVGLLLTPIPGFSGTVTFSCTSSAPQFITCAPAPSAVKLSPTGTQVAVVVNTFCSGEAPGSEPGKGPWPGGVGVGVQMLLAALALGGMVWSYRRRSRWALSFAVLVLMALGSAACNSLPKGPAGATPPGNYQLTITATANGQSAQVQANILVVQ